MTNNKKAILLCGAVIGALLGSVSFHGTSYAYGESSFFGDAPAWAAPEENTAPSENQKKTVNNIEGNNFWLDEMGNPHYETERDVQEAAQRHAAYEARRNHAQTNQKQNSQTGTAAAGQQDTSVSPQNPMYVTADKMRYDPTTGDVNAYGRVDIRHMMDRYQAEYIYGNTIAQKYVIPGDVYWKNETTDLKAKRADYDAAKQMAHFSDVTGWDQDKYYYTGADGVYDRGSNKITVEQGILTTKHAIAKVPDYSVTADYIDIYPGDHYTAHNAKLKFKNFTLLTMKTYSGSLAPGEDSVNLWNLVPRPSYDSDNGWGFANGIDIPIAHNPDLLFYMKNRWYNRKGFEPDIGFRCKTGIGNFRLRYAKDESTVNDDHKWVKKRPSFSFSSNRYYVGNTHFFTRVDGEIGYWEEGSVKGNHKDFDVYLSRDPIQLGPHMSFNGRVGYRKDYYGYHNLIRRNSYYSVGLSGGYSRFNAWVNYTNNDLKGETPYSFDTYDIEKPLNVGFRVQVTPLDAFSISYTYGTTNGVLEHKYFTYYRDMHSFYGWVRYDKVEHEWKFMIAPKDFTF